MDNFAYIGIDPGNSGGIAYLVNKEIVCIKFPKDLKDLISILKSLKKKYRCYAYMELVHSFPNQGVKSTFTFGENFGKWKGILETVGIDYKLIPPRVWMSYYGERPKEKQERKKYLKLIAKKLYSNTHITLYTADAVLIANYLKETYEE